MKHEEHEEHQVEDPGLLMTDLVVLGRLKFRDFLRLDARTLRTIVTDRDCRPDLEQALADQPDVLRRLLSAGMGPIRPIGPVGPAATAAQARLVRRWAFELLREKAPALWDALPCYGWDVAAATRRYPPWKTRFLLAGEAAASCLAALRRTAGVFCVEPLPAVCDYLVLKAELLRARRVRVMTADLDRIPLPAGAADLAIVGPGLGPDPDAALTELARVSRATRLLDLRPGGRIPDPGWLGRHGFVREQDGWWRGPDALTPASASK